MKPTADDILKMIAEGYYDGCIEDRYIVVKNPDYNDPWDDPFIVWDTWKGKEDE